MVPVFFEGKKVMEGMKEKYKAPKRTGRYEGFGDGSFHRTINLYR
jgi:hypothetical protein